MELHANNNGNSSVVSHRKRKKEKESESDDEIEILLSPKKKRRISASVHLSCNGTKFKRLIMIMDRKETNLKDLSYNYFDNLKWIKNKGVDVEVKDLSNLDYIIIIEDEFGIRYLIDFGVERKRFDDLHQSLLDGRANEQKQRLKKLPQITRKYYIIEGESRMVRDSSDRRQCNEFIKETKKEYIVIETRSKQQSMDKICDLYFHIKSLLIQNEDKLIIAM